MAWVEFRADVKIACPPERAFDWFADHRHVAQVLDGVSRWEPMGSRATGAGARYDVEMVTFGVPLHNVLRISRWRRPAEIGWVSESGLIKQEGGFTFTEVEGGVKVELKIAYQPPGAMLGGAIARRMDFAVRRRLEQALEKIRDRLEA